MATVLISILVFAAAMGGLALRLLLADDVPAIRGCSAAAKCRTATQRPCPRPQPRAEET